MIRKSGNRSPFGTNARRLPADHAHISDRIMSWPYNHFFHLKNT